MNSIAVETIQAVTAKHFDLTLVELNSPRQFKRLSHPRHVAMTLTRILTNKPWSEIGRDFGGRDHSSVMSGVQKIANLVETDAEFKKEFETLHTSLLPLTKNFGVRSTFARNLAPIIADELDRNLSIQLAIARAEHQQRGKLIKPDLLPAIERTLLDYSTYENDMFTTAETASLTRFLKSFEKLRAVYRRGQSEPKGYSK